jgi:hypothetical protein
MRMRRISLLLAAAAVLGACAESGDRLLSPQGPRLTITTVPVTCPDTISVGQTANCQAYAYDENNNLVSTATFTWGTTTSTLITVGTSTTGTNPITGKAVGNAVVQATAGGVTTNRSVYVKPGLSVSINGRTLVKRFYDVCGWVAVVSGGTAPYTYAWDPQGGDGTVSANHFDGSVISASMNLYVTVTDANGVQKTVSKTVSGTSSTLVCSP